MEPAAKKRLEFDQPPSCMPKRKKVTISKTKRAGLVFSVPKITKKIKVSGSLMFGQFKFLLSSYSFDPFFRRSGSYLNSNINHDINERETAFLSSCLVPLLILSS